MTLSIISDFILENTYNCDANILRKIYDILLILEPYFGDDTLDIIINCVSESYVSEPRKPYLIADELYYRVSKVQKNDIHRQILLLIEGKISIHDINKKRTNVTTLPIYDCVSCGEITIYDKDNKKYSCNNCEAEYLV